MPKYKSHLLFYVFSPLQAERAQNPNTIIHDMSHLDFLVQQKKKNKKKTDKNNFRKNIKNKKTFFSSFAIFVLKTFSTVALKIMNNMFGA